MNWFKIRKIREKNLIWMKFRWYIDFVILICCLVIAFNINPSATLLDYDTWEHLKMLYVFHDYEWNEYVMNDNVHGVSNSRDYLFNDEIPNDLKWEDNTHGVYLPDIEDIWKDDNHGADSIKDNQVSMDDILSDLWLESKENIEWDSINNDGLVINVSDYDSWANNDSLYTVNENIWDDGSSSLVIEKINDKEDEWLLSAKTFSYIEDGRIIPILVPWNDLFFGDAKQSITNSPNSSMSNWNSDSNTNWKWWIEIIDSYASCMTPWWYKISHWDSVLAYEQIGNNPGLCNIERRFCWKWKLSWKYIQQWCRMDSNYETEERWNNEYDDNSKTKQYVWNSWNKWNSWSAWNAWNIWDEWNSRETSNVAVNIDEEIWGEFVFDRPSKRHTEFEDNEDNIVVKEEVDQTTRPYWNCTTPWWEKVEHGQFIQAFKHANWFTDAPCETQLRLCSMWELAWTFQQSSCKPRDVSFIDWINWVTDPLWYSREKLNLIKKQIREEENAYKKEGNDRSTNSVYLDKILWILDE